MLFFMLHNFHKMHILQFLYSFGKKPSLPLNAQLHHYFQRHKNIGATDREILRGVIYNMVRFLGLINHALPWEERLECFLSTNFFSHPHQHLTYPQELYHILLSSIGEKKTKEFCRFSNQPAPLTIRTNLIKTSRAKLAKHFLLKKIPFSLCQESPFGITFHNKIPLTNTPQFKRGLFEIQDESSQIIADYIHVARDEIVLDFCAGSGGKSLAIAAQSQNSYIYLYDIRAHALQKAQKRLHRAGVKNATLIFPHEQKKLSSLCQKCHHVLLDVPCSNSGTLRRAPEQKWLFSLPYLQGLIDKQRSIFHQALAFVRPQGQIIYSTCSVLPQENEEQIHYFSHTYKITQIKPQIKNFPRPGEKDGFFVSALGIS